MRHWKIGATSALVGSALLLAFPLLSTTARADTTASGAFSTSSKIMHAQATPAQVTAVTKPHTVAYSTHSPVKANGRVARGGGLSCVPFARMESGIVVGGNAWQWWGNAAGTYARGATPEPGSVLAFRANGRMRLGHVAVVARVINGREMLIDHANWPSGGGRGGVSQSIPVVDVSEANDWSAVRVSLGNGDYGSVYPTYGFIYDRPDNGIIEAHRGTTAQQVAELNPAPRDLRRSAARPVRHYDEVADMPSQNHRHTVVLINR